MLEDEIQKMLITITLTFYLSKYAINQMIFIKKIFKIEKADNFLKKYFFYVYYKFYTHINTIFAFPNA